MTIKQQVERLVKDAQLFTAIEHELQDDEELLWDSMSLIWFITSLEEHFAIELDYRTVDLNHFATLQMIEQLIRNERKGVRL